MNATLLLMPLDGSRLRWSLRDGDVTDAGEIDSGDLASLRERDAAVVFAVPGECLLLESVGFTAAERRVLQRTVPYSMEDSLLADVATLHVALGPPQGDTVPVAVVEREWLARWLATLAQAGLRLCKVQPEPLLLPWEEGAWSLRAEGERWVVRLGEFSGFTLEREAALVALGLALEAAGPPRRLRIDSATAGLLEALPEPLRPVACVDAFDGFDLLSGRLDLCQGAFARRLPWRRWAREWRWPAAMVAGALLVQFGLLALDYQRLGERNIELRRQIEQVYRSVEPNGALTDAEVQLRRRVAALAGDADGGFLPAFDKLGRGLAGSTGITLQSLNYSESEIRIHLLADSFEAVEAVRQAIVERGLRAELVGSSADGERTRAQLKVWQEG